MSNEAYADWRAECDAIHKEMDQIITSAWLQTAQEREIRRTQYMALIERRDAAARKFMQIKPGARAVAVKAATNQQGDPSERPQTQSPQHPPELMTSVQAILNRALK